MYVEVKEELKKLEGNQIVRLIQKANTAFRDSLGGGIMERLDDIVKLIALKVFDEKEFIMGEKDELDFCVKANETSNQVFIRITQLFHRHVNHPDFTGVYPEKFKVFTKDKNAVFEIARTWSLYSFHNSFEDIKGTAFQEILKNTFDKNDNQQFFTPSELGEFIGEVALLSMKGKENKQNFRICDPAIGTGSLLLQLIKKSFGEYGDNFDFKLHGADSEERMAWLASLNIYFTTGKMGEVFHLNDSGGSLNKLSYFRELPNNHFDIIVTNPPFGSEINKADILSQYSLGNKSSRRRSILFVERCLELVKPGGIIVMVIDDSVLNSPKNSDVRRYINNNAVVKAIFSLPDTAFMPYASVKASIIVLEKNESVKSENTAKTLMVEINHIGRKPNGDVLYREEKVNGKRMIESDLPETVSIYKEFLETNNSVEKSINNWVINHEDLLKSSIDDGLRSWEESRLDILRYHPLSQQAEESLKNSKHKVVMLKEILQVRSERVNPSDTPDEIFRHIGLADIEKDTGVWEYQEVYGDSIRSSTNKFYPGDIIYARMRPYLKKVICIPLHENDGICSAECVVLSLNEDVKQFVLAEYVEWMLRSDLIYGQVMGKVTGIGRPRISTSNLLNCKLPIPSLKDQELVVLKLEQARRHLQNTKEQIKRTLMDVENSYNQEFSNVQQELLTK